MKYFINVEYYYEPNLKEIRYNEELKEKSDDMSSFTCQYNPHEIFDCSSVAIFQNNIWKIVGGIEFADLSDSETEDFPVLYIRSKSIVYVGRNSKPQENKTSSINPYDWLSEYTDEYTMDWDDILLEAANSYFIWENVGFYPEEENLLSTLYQLEWKKSICWESGQDEGGFEITEHITDIK